MAKGFTDIAIRNREIPDPGATGLYLIVQPSGKKSFAVRYRFDGRPKKLTLSIGGLIMKKHMQLATNQYPSPCPKPLILYKKENCEKSPDDA